MQDLEASGDHHGGAHSVLSEWGGDGSGGNWNTKSRWRFGDRRDIQMEAQYASEYLAGDCELYGDVASGMRKREMEKFHSSEPLFLAVISAIGLRIICTQNPTIE